LTIYICAKLILTKSKKILFIARKRYHNNSNIIVENISILRENNLNRSAKSAIKVKSKKGKN